MGADLSQGITVFNFIYILQLYFENLNKLDNLHSFEHKNISPNSKSTKFALKPLFF